MSLPTPTAAAAAGERFKNRTPIPAPTPAYLARASPSPLAVDKALYDAVQKADRVLVQDFTLPIRSGRAWEVPEGCIVRISTPEGPQVGECMDI